MPSISKTTDCTVLVLVASQVILTGDFNLTPTDSIYNFVTNGSLQYEGLSRDLTAPDDRPGKSLAKELIPPYLNVTDQCQHLTVVQSRADATGTRGSLQPPPAWTSGLVSF